MIRQFTTADMDAVLAIWLSASVKAHDFIEPSFWQSQTGNMRDVYLPASDIVVFDSGEGVTGFYALHENTLAAIFVAPEQQGLGIGRQLVDHAKIQRSTLTLSVYKANEASVRFYLSQGFKPVSEQNDVHTGHPEYTMSWSADTVDQRKG